MRHVVTGQTGTLVQIRGSGDSRRGRSARVRWDAAGRCGWGWLDDLRAEQQNDRAGQSVIGISRAGPY